MTKLKKSATKSRYTFSLVGVNIDKVYQKYGIGITTNVSEDDNTVIPENTTKIEDLEMSIKTPDILSFLDESKRVRKCTVSMIDFTTGNDRYDKKKKYRCFWDRDFIPDGVHPIGCPVRHVPSQVTKSYYSEISKDRYSISEKVTTKKLEELKERGDNRMKLLNKDYYITEGVFCSFNCCMAYIESHENKNNPLYTYSEMLLLQMYSRLHNGERNVEIIPAQHWKKIDVNGGDLTIEQFRESFNKVECQDHGLYMSSLGRLYEENLRF